MYVEGHQRATLKLGGAEDLVIRLGQVLTVVPLTQRGRVNCPFAKKASYIRGDMFVKQEADGHSGADLAQPRNFALEILGTKALRFFYERFDFVSIGFSIREC